MSHARCIARAQVGISAPEVTVEVQVNGGLPQTIIVGLPETTVKESKERVRGAMVNSNFTYPDGKVVINLAPADLPKEGGRYDLPIALSILAATGQLDSSALEHHEFAGELALTGELRSVRGILPIALAASRATRSLLLPYDNAQEASLVSSSQLFAPRTLLEAVSHLRKHKILSPLESVVPDPAGTTAQLSDVRGQYQAKRALVIAAAGGHNLLFQGPPGTGKTMLANRLISLLPHLTLEEALEVASIHSIAGQPVQTNRLFVPPYRSPHHSSSAAALVGGGGLPRPGEISLAHRGVLFLDELPEYGRRVLETLREPLESGEVTISRTRQRVNYPARFQLIAAMNPCPCGYHGDPSNRCYCTLERIARYRQRVSGPLLDRIDMHVEVPALPRGLLTSPASQLPSETDLPLLRIDIINARNIMYARAQSANSQLPAGLLETCCKLSSNDRQLLDDAMHDKFLSARGYHRVLRVARTIADLDSRADIITSDLTEALGYRQIDVAD